MHRWTFTAVLILNGFAHSCLRAHRPVLDRWSIVTKLAVICLQLKTMEWVSMLPSQHRSDLMVGLGRLQLRCSRDKFTTHRQMSTASTMPLTTTIIVNSKRYVIRTNQDGSTFASKLISFAYNTICQWLIHTHSKKCLCHCRGPPVNMLWPSTAC